MAPELLRHEPNLSSSSSPTDSAYRNFDRNFVHPEWIRLLSLSLLLIITTFTPALHAQDNQDNQSNKGKLSLDPARSEVHFTLADTLHIVHGTFHIQQGDIGFDPTTGKATGSITVDAPSGQSGNAIRDHRMIKDELRAPDFKTITFAPTRITGTLNSAGDSTFQVHGVFTLLGTPHEIDVPMQVQVNGDQLHTIGSFAVPYIQWGLKDPSTFMIHVNKEVQIDLDLSGTLRR